MHKSIITLLFIVNTISLSATDFITLGTGEENGTYYPVGLSMCKFLNTHQKQIRCSVESTHGAIANTKAVLNQKFNFAISQSDTIYHAINQEMNFKDIDSSNLRSVIVVYTELLTFIVNEQSNIKTIEDIKNKRINIGSPNSGSELTTLEVLKQFNINKADLAVASSLDAMDTVDALKDDLIDGYFFMVGHPTQNIKDAIKIPNTKIIPIDGPIVDILVQEQNYFTKSYIDANLYNGISKPIPTVGTQSMIITNKNVSEELVYNFVKVILENFDEFKASHRVYNHLTKESLFEGLVAPAHKGVIKYLKENNIYLDEL